MCRILIPLLFAFSVAGAYFAPDWGRIVGGDDATKKDIPWMVSIVQYGAHHCGAAIISKKTILTAAHCIFGLNLRWTKIRAGSKLASSGGVLVPVEDAFMHPDFNLATMNNDIGIIRLKDEIVFSENIKPIPVPQHGFMVKNGTTAMVSGWGFLSNEGPYSEILQYLLITAYEREFCNRLLSNKVFETMICAGRLEGGHDACQMDSGSPLVANNMLVGVVSWGVGCAEPNFPGVYTNIAAMRPWIDKSLSKYGEKLPCY